MLNINNLNNGNLDNTKSDNVVELNNSDKFVDTNQDKIDYAFKMLEQSGINPSDYMYMYEDNGHWYFKDKLTREYLELAKATKLGFTNNLPSISEGADLTPRQIIDNKTIDCLPIHAEKKTIFTPEIRQLSNGSTVEAVNDWNILAEDIDTDSITYGEFIHKLGSTVTHDYNYYPMVEKIKMFNDQISEKFSNYLVNSDSVEVKQSTAYNGAYYQAKYIFKDIFAEVSVADKGFKTKLFLEINFSTGLGGIASNNIWFKTFDSFCENGLIFFGKSGLGKLKHTKNSNIEFYMDNSTDNIISNFVENVELMQSKTELEVSTSQVLQAIELFTKSKFADLANRKRDTRTLAHSLLAQAEMEFENRGQNVFALDSVFTAFATHGDSSRHTVHGFQTRNTGSDHQAMTLDTRQKEVHRFLNSAKLQELLEVA